ncbi:MAG: metallophosphoesterase [Candidatus Latescibacterota bacterium]
MKKVLALLVAATATAALAQGEPFACGPYLLDPGPRRMTVVVDHPHPVAAALEYRRADGTGRPRAVVRREAARHHLFALEELEPDTWYEYRVASGRAHDSGPRTFRTPPEAPERFRLVVLGDTRSQPEEWRRVSQRVFAHEPEALFAVGTGDYPADGSQYEQWVAQFFAPGRDLLARLPIFPSIGNHERTRQYLSTPPPDEEERSHYFSLFELPGNERWYRVDYGYLTLLVLDSNSQLAPGHEQYEWLLEQLRAERRRFTLAAFHHPPFTSGPHGRLQADGTPREGPMDQGQRFLVPLFERYGVDLVVNGHDHLYERSHKDGVYYVVSGGAGAPLYEVDSAPNPYQQVAVATHHYLGIDVDRASMTVSAVDAQGELVDWFVVPLGARTQERCQRLAAERLGQGVACRPASPASGEVECILPNPLGFPLTVEVASGDTAQRLAPQRLSLPACQTAAARVPLTGLAERLAQPPWRGRLSVPLALTFRGNDAGIPILARIGREVAVREASFTVSRVAAPTVDGDLAEWSGVPTMAVDEDSPTVHNRDLYSGNGDLRAAVRLGWSPQALHLSLDVVDDALVDAEAREVWENDSVELYLDGRPEAERSAAYGPLVSQNILPVLRPVGVVFAGNNGWPAEAIDWALRHSQHGYSVEASIPFGRICGRPQGRPGETLRFDLMINDRDNPEGGQSHHRLWSTGGASSSTEGFGLLVLGE